MDGFSVCACSEDVPYEVGVHIRLYFGQAVKVAHDMEHPHVKWRIEPVETLWVIECRGCTITLFQQGFFDSGLSGPGRMQAFMPCPRSMDALWQPLFLPYGEAFVPRA